MPEIGHPESYYARLAKTAEQMGMIHAHEAAKVGQYITLGLDPHHDWDAKRKYFRHALRRHCEAPQVGDDLVSMYYQRLGDFVRKHAGAEAIRIASRADEDYASRLRLGEPRERVAKEAAEFFYKLVGAEEHCPSYFNEEDWSQLRILSSAWLPPPEESIEDIGGDETADLDAKDL